MKSIQDDFCFKGMCQGKFEKKGKKTEKKKQDQPTRKTWTWKQPEIEKIKKTKLQSCLNVSLWCWTSGNKSARDTVAQKCLKSDRTLGIFNK